MPHSPAPGDGLGYRPALDGLRAVSVVAVVLYHAGFGWMGGGFFGVEVFFVISGFLITSLLIDERVATGGTSLGAFWLRRARRLLPALVTLLVVVAVWGLLFGSAEQASQLRHDLPWSILYAANWGQIVGDVPYFAPGDPPLLRHLWSLAVEEQWYLLWPLAFIALAGLGWRARRTAALLVLAAGAVSGLVWYLERGGDSPMSGPGWLEGADRVNLMYLSTVTRASGLLIGAALAFAWRPWRHRARNVSSAALDALAAGVFAVLGACFVLGEVTARVTYPWVMAAVSLASALAVLLTVHPRARVVDRVLASPPAAAIGRRSYGIYLWHWPVFVVVGATEGSWWRFVVAGVVAGALSELCYRYVEMPIRGGVIGRLWSRRPAFVLAPAGGAALVSVALAVSFVQVDTFDVAIGGDQAEFVLATAPPSHPIATSAQPVPVGTPSTLHIPVAVAPSTSAGTQPPSTSSTVGLITTTTTGPRSSTTTTTTLPVLPRSVAIVGDSQAHSLAVNLPSGIDPYFTFVDGSVDGCSVHEAGRVLTARRGFRNDFGGICRGWASEWAAAADDADVALVMLGAWDVFDLEIDGEVIEFGSRAYDRLFTEHLRRGLDGLAFVGAHAALLEVGCMRPVDARGAGVPALPERGDDSRVAHLNALLRQVAAADPEHVTFVPGPDAWCRDETIATDRDYRWDGVHVYQRGADLIFEEIAGALLAIPVEHPAED